MSQAPTLTDRTHTLERFDVTYLLMLRVVGLHVVDCTMWTGSQTSVPFAELCVH